MSLRKVRSWFFFFMILLAVGEAGARLRYFITSHYNSAFLIVPFFGTDLQSSLGHDTGDSGVTHTLFEPESGRTITFTINHLGWRGAEWRLEKEKGTLRIAAMGASSTYGTNNPDWATWPVFLGQELNRQGKKVEVLNASWPGIKLADILYRYEMTARRYKPDGVIYYEGWNDTPLVGNAAEVDAQIRRLHLYTPLGRWLSVLYYRSMLYTFLLERAEFLHVKELKAEGVPNVRLFQIQFRRFIEVLRRDGVVPVVVLQANNSLPRASVRDLRLDDFTAVRVFILEGERADPRTDFAVGEKIRFYQAQVLVEAARRIAQELGIQVIDPRGSFARRMDSQRLFYGPIHLTDFGNQLLASEIAKQIRLPGERASQD